MGQQENSQYEIPDLSFSVAKRPARADSWTDIGNAKVTHTIFGRAKVSVIRKQDHARRAWLLGTLAVTVVCAATWFALNNSKSLSSVIPSITVSPVSSQPSALAPTGSSKSASSQKSALKKLPTSKTLKRKVEKPIPSRSLEKNKPKPVSNDSQPLSKLPATSQQALKV